MPDLDRLIDELSEQGSAVPVVTTGAGKAMFGAVAALTLCAVAALVGLRPDVLALRLPAQLTIETGLLAVLAVSAGFGAIRMARPQVGAASSGTQWALAAVGTLLVAALAAIAGGSRDAAMAAGLSCFSAGLTYGSATLLFLGWWLRRGAPVNPGLASWLAGIAAGAVGAVAVSLECERDAIAHSGIWHVAPIATGAIVARLVLPRLIRW